MWGKNQKSQIWQTESKKEGKEWKNIWRNNRNVLNLAETIKLFIRQTQWIPNIMNTKKTLPSMLKPNYQKPIEKSEKSLKQPEIKTNYK